MSDTKLTQEDVQQILRLIQSAEHVAEFTLKYGDVEIGLSRSGGDAAKPPSTPAPVHTAPAVAPPAVAPPAAAPKPDAIGAGMSAIKSPMVGTFYRSPAPGAPPFVEIGSKVDAHTTVCIIEVMKLMNSISAGMSGTVREIRAADAEPVEFGQVLIVIEPDAR